MIKNAKESHLRKAKGEKLQKEIVAELKKQFPNHADNIKSSPMSAHGEDVQLTDEARKAIPFSFEAKYKEKGLSIVYSAYEQAQLLNQLVLQPVQCPCRHLLQTFQQVSLL